MAGRRRAAEQREGWWREPPVWAWVAMVVGAVLIVVLTPIALGRGQLSPTEVQRLDARAAQGRTTAPGSSAAPSSTAAPTTRVVVIGDSDTGGFGDAGTGDAGWPALLQDRLGDVGVQAVTAAGAGYVAADPGSGQTFADLAATAPVEDAAVVVVFGSRNDGPGIADQVSDAAGTLYADLQRRDPDGRLVVIGPPWPSASPPAGVRNNRDVLSQAADAVGADFVDPLADDWLVDDPALIGIDGVHLTDAGHAYLADRVEPVLRQALGR